MATPAAVVAIVVEAQTGKAKRELDLFDRRVKKSDGQKAMAQLGAVVDTGGFKVHSALVRKADLQKAEATLGFDVDTGGLARLKAAQAVVTKESNKLGDVFNRSQLSIGQWTGIIVASLPVVLDLAGALGALTASAAAATAGLGALAVGVGGALSVGLGGIAAIAIPAISSLKEVITGQEALNKARSTGSASAAKTAAAATQQITAAENTLANAQRSEKIAQDSLNLARKEAVRDLQDMKRAALESGTSEKRARLSLRQAEQNLRELRRGGEATMLDIRDAELSVVEARQNVKDVSIAAGRAQADYNKAQKGGISQMPGVVSAQRSLADAQRATADANKALARAQQEANAATGAGATQLAALRLAQKKAGPEAVRFAKNLKEIGHRWKILTREGRNDFFGFLNDGLRRTNKMLPMLAESANSSMKALRVGFDAFLDRATGPGFNKFIDVMTRTFANSMKPIGEAFGNIAIVLERLAVAVAPDIVRMVKGFKEMTQGWVDSTRNAKDLRETVHGLVNQANTWWKLIKATAGLIAAVLVPGMGKGKQAVEGITASIKEWTNWVNAHPEAVRDFMKEGLETTKQLVDALLSFLPTLFEISKATRPIARFFLAFLKALNTIKVGNVSALTVLLGLFVGGKVIGGVLGTASAFRKLATALGLVSAAEAGASGGGMFGGKGKATTVPLGAGTSATTVTGRTIGSTGKAAGATWGARFASAARGAIIPAFGGLSLAVAGSFAAQPILKKFHDIAQRAADDFPKPFGDIGDAIADLGIPDSILPKVPEHPGGLLGLLGVGKDAVDKLDELAAGVRGGKAALKGFERVLKGLSSMPAQEAIDALRKKFGSLVVAGHEMGKKQREVFLNMMLAARENGQITQRQLEKVTDAFDDNTEKWNRSMRRVAQVTGEKTQDVKDAVRGMSVRVSDDYDNMVRVTGHGLDILGSNTNRMLKGLGVKQVQFNVSHGMTPGGDIKGGPRRQAGGMVVPGTGSGDKVPVRAMVEPGEALAVLNRNAAKAWMKWNEKVPRFQKGGMSAMLAEANKFEARSFPYVLGGGHGSFGIQPVDCSGAVSDVLHAAGLLNAPMVSGALMNWGKPGKGPLTVYANPDHTIMSLNGRVFGTSGSNPGGGAGWIDGASGQSLAPGAVRTMDVVGGMIGDLKRIILKGPKGPLTDTGQGALDKSWKAAKAYIAKKTPSGAFGGGQPLKDLGPGSLSRSEMQRLLSANRLPDIMGWVAGAESLWNPKAHNPSGASGLWQIMMPLHSGLVGNRNVFDPNVNADVAARLYQESGLTPWAESKFKGALPGGWSPHMGEKFRRGGVVEPFVGSFARGGEVARDGVAKVHKGETVLPKPSFDVLPFMRRLLHDLLDLPTGFGKELKKEFHKLHAMNNRTAKEQRRFEELRQRRWDHRRERRQVRAVLSGGGPKQLQKALALIAKNGVRFGKAQEKQLEELKKQRRHHNLDRQERRQLHRLERRERRFEHQEKLEERIREQIAVEKELIAEHKELRKDLKEHNRLVRTVRANEKDALRAVVNLTASQIGAQGLQKRRLASAGSAVRY